MDALNEYLRQFQQSLDRGDWEAIAVLQADLKDTVEKAGSQLASVDEEQAFSEALIRLNELVQKAVGLAADAKQQTAEELRKLSVGQAAASSYGQHTGDPS